MLRYLVFLVIVMVAAAWYVPQRLGALPQQSQEAAVQKASRTVQRQQPVRQASRTRPEPMQSSHGRKVRLKLGQGGHFRADVRINGRKMEMLVDTGASVIALTARDARRMGVYPSADKFIYKARTANGVTNVALVELEEVRLGRISVRNVRAAVHKGRGLSTNLLGMSFLNRLKKFHVEGDTLTLVN